MLSDKNTSIAPSSESGVFMTMSGQPSPDRSPIASAELTPLFIMPVSPVASARVR